VPARAITLALAEAGLPPEAIEYVNAHGSATALNDTTETLAVKLALGEHAYRVPVSGTKGLHAHALGATGAVETAITALAMAHGYLPSTANLFEPGAGCDLDYLRGSGRPARARYALKNSFGFGGINAALVLGAAP
jgi:3-oxoacyl-[acyl-carrier-protein] synthase II